MDETTQKPILLFIITPDEWNMIKQAVTASLKHSSVWVTKRILLYGGN